MGDQVRAAEHEDELQGGHEDGHGSGGAERAAGARSQWGRGHALLWLHLGLLLHDFQGAQPGPHQSPGAPPSDRQGLDHPSHTMLLLLATLNLH